LEYLGRRDHQVKIRGFRIELGEIEVLLAAHPAVNQAVVVVRETVPGERELVAYVIPHHSGDAPQTPILQRDLRTFLADQLPMYMVPAHVVVMNAFSLTPSGKVDRLALPAPQRGAAVGKPDTLVHATAVEREMAAVWGRVLRLDAVGVEDNFFELGGHSLLAVRLYAEIEKTFGIRLPSSLLLRAPTVRALSAALADEQAHAPSSSLVTIQASGRHHPLFCVHALGGAVLGYAVLASHLGPDFPVYGLQGRGFDGTQEPDANMVEMAAHYVAEVRSAQPRGPYHLCGLSAGGVIAFEMAQQLRQQGEQVALLAMLDSQPLNSAGQTRTMWLQPRFYVELLRDLRHYAVDYVTNRTTKQRLNSIRRLVSVMGRRILGVDGRAAARADAADATRIGPMLFDEWMRERTAELPEHIAKCALAHAQALKHYVPGPYAGHITVFRAYSQRLFSAHRWDLGWAQLAAGGVEVHRVPGNHVTLIREPHVRVLAEHLRTSITRAGFKATSRDAGDPPRAATSRHPAPTALPATPAAER
jgi:thioesterase domain-containing protein/acyl carrier protein